ncbi:hypothetical protein P9695_08755 [Weizmannia sp. CD-2023]|uniref:hypothetical protein n=1 Tax=Heyndrickxia TaxID=2837504 RepID=UPI002E1E51EB|nr:hypothetical protein [Weizmannia sp. CD-2023]MED4899710.1 hypothetical protein [Weizmannia sp. CD-2023]
MANKQRGIVEVELDKVRHIRYTMNALAEIEDKLGYGLADLDGKQLKIKEVRVILWAGLIHEDPELTEEQVGDMIDLGNMQYVQGKMSEAFEQAQVKN